MIPPHAMTRKVAFQSQEKSANKEIKGISRWPDLPHRFNPIYMHLDQQLDTENLCDMKGNGPNHQVQYQKVTRNDNC